MLRTLTLRRAVLAAVLITAALGVPVQVGAAGRYANPQLLVETEEVVYCQSGMRSSQDYLALRLLGHTRIRNYDGSWMEWATTPALPVER